MKAIVANVLFGSIFGCLGWTNSADAAPLDPLISLPVINSATSKTILHQDKYLDQKPNFSNLVDRVFSLNRSLDIVNKPTEIQTKKIFTQGKRPYTYTEEQINLVLGFQPTFWPSTYKKKYWGLTTVENWGKNTNKEKKSKLAQSNYTLAAPVLDIGNSQLTVSGGGNNNLGKAFNLDQKSEHIQDFQEFRGGLTYHRGVVEQITMGFGFVYEDLLVGFTQLTYASNILPLTTTLSLLTKESETDLYSHIKFQPSANFVLDFQSASAGNKFNLNWDVASALTLVGKVDTKEDAYSTGIKVSLDNTFMAFLATASLNANQNLDWKISSTIDGLSFVHSNEGKKSAFSLKTAPQSLGYFGFQCSGFFNYQTNQTKEKESEFLTGGAQLNSSTTISPNKHYWSVKLGYGSGSHGQGVIINSKIALKSNLFLKIDYQEISASSDESKFKLQLSSN